MAGLELAAGGDHEEAGLLGAAEPPPELGERGGRRRVDVVGRPERAAGRPERSGPDQDGVGARTQEPHHEVIGLAPPAQHPARVRLALDRDHPV
jgi:hypothetical protein